MFDPNIQLKVLENIDKKESRLLSPEHYKRLDQERAEEIKASRNSAYVKNYEQELEDKYNLSERYAQRLKELEAMGGQEKKIAQLKKWNKERCKNGYRI
jgi:hypothetical protein